jgi:hypothetical protein
MKIMCVSPSGDDTTGTGSFEAPYRTIEHALALFADGDQIRLLEGTFITTDSIVISGMSGSIFADYPGSSTVQPNAAISSAACIEIIHSDRFTIQGINVKQDVNRFANVGIYANDVDNFLCSTCSVNEFAVVSGDTYGILTSGYGRVENCHVYDMVSAGDKMYGIYSANMHVIDCEVYSLSGTHDVTGICMAASLLPFQVLDITFVF